MYKQTKMLKTGGTPNRRGWLVPAMLAIMALLLGAVIVLGSGFLSGRAAYAQAEAPAANEITPDEVTPDEVNTVAREIWCPLCSGVRLDACELKACVQMKDVIAIKLSEGEDTASIKAYFVEQYGPQVLGEPPRSGFNWLAWILPVVAVVVGGFIFWRTAQRMVQPATPLGAGLGLDHHTGGASPSNQQAALVAKPNAGPVSNPGHGNPNAVIDEDDEYQQKLEEELAKYG